MTLRRRALALGLGLGLLAAGCGQGERMTVAVAHLAAEGAPAGAAAPLAAIERDTRPVLHAWPQLRIHDARDVPLPPDGRLRLRIPVPPALRGRPTLVLEAFARGNPRLDSYRREFAGEVAIEGSGDAAALPLELRIDPRRAWRAHGASPTVSVFVVARARPEALVETRIAPVEIPPGGVLDLSLGIEEAAWGQAPVAFRALACSEAGECEPILQETLDPRGPEAGRWRSRRIDLAARAGERVALRFETVAGAGGWSLPLWSTPALCVPRERGPADLDLVLVSIDTLRADHLPSYGYARETAPFVAELAARGTLFEQAFAAAPSTSPSHMTMFTSQEPSVHGLLGNEALAVLPRGVPTLAERLRAEGLANGAATEGGAVTAGVGFERGFDSFQENPMPVPHRPGLQAPVTFADALAWLRAQRDRRSFLFVHTYEVHGPYRAPDAYARLFEGDAPGLAGDPRLRPHQRPVLYDREIRFADDELRRFFAALEAEGRLAHTLVVVTSDHGEEFLEHGYLGHGATLPDEVLRVPLLLVGPGIPAGRRVGTPVGHLDLLPTLLELLGAPPLPGARGASYAALARGGAEDPARSPRPLFAETWFRAGFGARGPQPVEPPSYAVRVGARKLVRVRDGSGFRDAYYDLARDPGEHHDLAAEDPAAAAELRALLDAHLERSAALRADVVDGASERPLHPEREDELRALGYLE